jgi:chromosomal replication initiation ATPase DnaA
MTLTNPEVRKIILDAQLKVRNLTGDKTVVLIPQSNSSLLIQYEHLCELVCSVTGVDYKDAVRKTRSTLQRRTRRLITYFAYQHCRMTYKHIGELLGGRHHTTMISSVAVIQDLIHTNDSMVCEYVNEINSKINAVLMPAESL